jgi:hypothetical protein
VSRKIFEAQAENASEMSARIMMQFDDAAEDAECRRTNRICPLCCENERKTPAIWDRAPVTNTPRCIEGRSGTHVGTFRFYTRRFIDSPNHLGCGKRKAVG